MDQWLDRLLHSEVRERSQLLRRVQKEEKDERERKEEKEGANDGVLQRFIRHHVRAPSAVGRRMKLVTDVFADVEMFDPYIGSGGSDGSGDSGDSGAAPTVFDSLVAAACGSSSAAVNGHRNHLISKGGRKFLRAMVESPVSDTEVLRRRSDVVGDIVTRRLNRSDVHVDVDRARACVSSCEGDFAWLYADRNDDASVALHDIAFFNAWFLRGLNRHPVALTGLNLYRIAVSPLIGVLSPLVYFVIPYLVLCNRMRQCGVWRECPPFRVYISAMFQSFSQASGEWLSGVPSSLHWVKYVSCGLSLLFYFQSLFNTFEVSRTLRIVCDMINTKMRNAELFQRSAAYVVKECWHEGITDAFFSDADVLPPHDHHLRGWATSYTDAGEETAYASSWWTLGERLSRFKSFDRTLNMRLARTYYAVDSVLAVCEQGSSPGFCRVDFDTSSSRCHLDMKGLWHPCLRLTDCVTNDVSMQDGTILLTGPNAGGKSTLLKSVVVAALLAHTTTVVPCERGCRMTAFAFLDSQICVPDVKGKRSLFEEEMYRARTNLCAVRELAGNALIVIDEIFSSTNPVEGVAGAFSVAKHLSMQPNCCSIISTHFTYLCGLSRSRHPVTGARRCRNMQMPVHMHTRGPDATTATTAAEGLSFVYPYKLRSGVCTQYVALELLKNAGFEPDVIADALQIKQTLTQPSMTSPKSGRTPLSNDRLRPRPRQGPGPGQRHPEPPTTTQTTPTDA